MGKLEFTELTNVNEVIAYVKTFGVMAPLVPWALVVQVALPVSICYSGRSRWTFIWFKMGFLLSWSGALVGATIAYWFAGCWEQIGPNAS